jgi:PAS domain S-box-containing protein
LTVRGKELDEVRKNQTDHQKAADTDSRAEKSNNENEIKYRIILENIQEGYFEVDLAGNFTFFSDSICKILGYPREELRGMNNRQYTDKENAKRLFKAFNSVFRTREPLKSLDWQIIKKDGSPGYIESSVSLKLDSSGRPAGFRGLVRDITERKKIEEKLYEEEQLLRILTDQSSDIIVLISAEGKIIYENKAVENILGYKTGERIGGSPYDNIHPDDVDIVRDTLSALLKDSHAPLQKEEIRIRHINGSWHTFEFVASNRNQGGVPELIIANLRDITKRKIAEAQRDAAIKELWKSEKFFKEISENSSDILIITDQNGSIKYCSRSFERFVGYKPEEVIGRNGFEFIHPDDIQRAVDDYVAALQADVNSLIHNAFRVIHKNGSEVYLDGLGRNLLNNPDIAGFVMNVRDITERKKIEEKLHEEENLFRTITENSSDIILLMDPQGFNLYINQAVEKHLGYKPQERIHARGLEIVHPDDLDRIKKGFFTLATNPNSPVVKTETRLRHKDGTWRIFETTASNLVQNNVVKAVVINHHNITKRKKTENALKESEENFRRSLDESPLGVRISTADGETLYANKAILDIYGYENIEELKSKSVRERYTPKSYIAFQVRQEKRLKGEFGPSEYEVSIVRKDGEIRHLHVTRKDMLWNGKKQYQVIYKDVTDYKRAEEAAYKEYNFSRSASDSLTVPFFMFDSETRVFFRWNKIFTTITGYADEELARMGPEDLIPRSELSRLEIIKKELKDTGHVSFEMPIVSKNGDTTPFLLTGNHLDYNDKLYVVGMGIDISESKRAEKALKESEERYRSVFENAGLPMVIMEDSLQIFMANGRFVNKLGYSKEEIEGRMKFTDFIVSPDHNSLMKCFSRRKGDKPVEYECQIAHRDGTKFDVIIRIGHIPEAKQFIASFTDITSRKQAEVALLASRENLKKENIRLRSSIGERYRFCDIIGKSQAMQEVYEFILKAAATQANVIIYGESGTGKELVAKAIHETSDRSRKKFVTVHCGAIPETLMESEFFGYKKGAFTGATMDKSGYLDEADGGILFLDEVGEIGLNMQVKLLRAISGDGYTPVGSNAIKKSDVRIIAATNRNLRELVKKGVIREDFFYRIHILPIYLPPLRERKNDLPLLIDHFLNFYDINHPPVPGEIFEALLNYDWPGNVRELQNVLHRYLTLKRLDYNELTKTRQIQLKEKVSKDQDSDHPAITRQDLHGRQKRLSQDHVEINTEESKMTLESIERDHIRRTLSENNWHRGRTAETLGINRKTLFLKMQKYGLNNPES